MRRSFPAVVALNFFKLMNFVMAESTRFPSVTLEISEDGSSDRPSSKAQMILSVAITGGMILSLELLLCLIVHVIARRDCQNRDNDNRLFANTFKKLSIPASRSTSISPFSPRFIA
ncbi:MAG: hypothetical protein Q8L78_01830 [Coxiellaceae bacterium]|nr:hypothetical protein [Coxiellaceae bacterium]